MTASILAFPRRFRVVPPIPEVRTVQRALETEAERHERLLAEADELLRRAAELREARLRAARETWPFGGAA